MKRLLSLLTLSIIIFSAEARTADCSAKWSEFDSQKSLKDKYSNIKGLCDLDAKDVLASKVRKSSSISYKDAKKRMFKRNGLDDQDGKVYSVYSDDFKPAGKVPFHREMNAEHTWPKSKGSKTKPAVSDLHHLYPCESEINSVRSSYPFCEVTKVVVDGGRSVLGTDKDGSTCFEPPKEHRGNVARAMFYFATRYQKRIDPKQEAWFKKWHKEDPVDASEITRNEAISRIQRNTNPYIDQPELVDFISDF